MMKKFLLLAAGIVLLLGLSQAASAQSASMYTLDDIYYYLIDGKPATPGGHDLEPPDGAEPGDTRGKGLSQIYEDTRDEFDQCNATVADVFEDKKFYCVQAGSWGVKSGTRPTTRPPTFWEAYGPQGSAAVVAVGEVFAARSKSDGGHHDASNWTEINNWADDLVFCGKADWRIPTHTEMWNIHLMENFFTYVSPGYWEEYDSMGCPGGEDPKFYPYTNLATGDRYCTYITGSACGRVVRDMPVIDGPVPERVQGRE